MKRFIFKILLFVLPITILAYPIDLLISHNLKKSKWFADGEYSVWNDIYNGKVNSDIVIYGSSKALIGLNPFIIQDSLGVPCYNLGLDGHNFWLVYLRHLELLKNNRKPDVIILSLDAMSMHRREGFYNYEQFLPYIFSKNIYDYTSFYKVYSFLDYKLPLWRYFGEGEAFCVAMANMFNLEKGKTNVRNRGFQEKDCSWTNEFENAKETIGHFDIHVDSSSVKLFKQFIEECESNNIKLILVLTPEYIGGQEFIRNRLQIISLYSKISNAYNIPFLDYSSDALCFNKEWFYNSMHLNKKGASIFTTKFTVDLKKYYKFN